MWLVVGYGNRLRGDDAAGPLLVEQLQDYLPAERARLLTVHQLTPELVEELVRPEIEQVLFIDVKRHQSTQHKLVRLDPTAAHTQSTGHQQQPELLLFAAEQLYQQKLSGWLLTLPGCRFDFSEQLSPNTSAALNAARNAVARLINKKG